MDKNTVTGFILIAAVLIGFSWWQKPSEAQIRQKQIEDSLIIVAQKKAEAAKAAQRAKAEVVKVDTTAAFYGATQGTASDVVLKNEKVELTISTKGGVVSKAVVKNYKDIDDKDGVTVFQGKDQKLDFQFEAKESNISTANLFFSTIEKTDSTVTLAAVAAEGKQIVLTYKLNGYLLDLQLKTLGMAGMFSPSMKEMNVLWEEKARQQEKGFSFENRFASLTYRESDGDIDYLNETKELKNEEIEDGLDWVAFKNQFFSAVIMSKDGFATGGKLTSIPEKKGSGYLKQYAATLKAPFDPTGAKASEFKFYYGPNDFRLLNSIEKGQTFDKEQDLQRLVYLGWPLFRIINRWFTIYVFDWLTSFGIPMGIVLIIITLILKAITYPMVRKSYMSSAKMRVLKPKLEEATKQYDKPEDAMKKQQAMMQLYSEYGVSPLGGCIPMLIQMPIWIAMFNFVPNAIQLRRQSFLWMDDLSTYDPIFEWGRNVWLIGDHLSLTCILFCVANVLYNMMTMRQQKDQMVGQQAEQVKMMQWVMFIMPLMFFFMFNDYSSGLNFYYFVSLFFSAAIMYVLRKTTNDEKLLAILEKKHAENKANPKRKVSGFAAQLEKMQKKQEEMQREREALRNKRRQQFKN